MDKQFFVDSATEAEQPEDVEEVEEETEEVEEQELEEEVDEVPADLEEVKEAEGDTIEIDGEKYTLDEVRNGMLRQQDYTRKTQELSKERERLEQAQFLSDYFAHNPQVLEAIRANEQVPEDVKQGTYGMHPLEQEIMNIRNEMEISKIEREIEDLSQRYPDFDEMEVLRTATEMGVNDLEFVYKAIRNVPSEEEIKAKAKEEAKAEILKEIEENKGKTRTLIKNEVDKPQDVTPELSAIESSIARKMGLSDEEYLKHK